MTIASDYDSLNKEQHCGASIALRRCAKSPNSKTAADSRWPLFCNRAFDAVRIGSGTTSIIPARALNGLAPITALIETQKRGIDNG